MRQIRFGAWMGMTTIVLGAALSPRPGHAARPEPGAPLWHRSLAIDIHVHPDGTSDSTETWSVRADTTAVAHIVAQQSFSSIADLETVQLQDAATIKPDGQRIPVQPGAVMDQRVTTLAEAPEFSAQLSRTILFPTVEAGDTVRYTLHRHGTVALFPGYFTTTLAPGPWAYLDHVEIGIALPPGMSLHVETAGLDGAVRELLPDGSTVRRWHLAASEGGNVLLDASSFADYAELGRAYAARAWPRSQPSAAVRALATRLTAGVTDPREQALRLYRYVATEIRYVAAFLGDGRVVPRDAGVVLAEGFGDCKDHAALLQALLSARGIAAQPALISLRALYTLPRAAGLGALNHVITYVPSLDLFLDSTAPYAPFGLLPAAEYDKPVVLADPAAARLSRTPALPPAPLELETATDARIDAEDVVSGTTITEASGPQGIALRSMAAWIEGRGLAGAASGQLRQLGTPGTGGFSFDPPEDAGAAYRVHARFRLDDPLADGGEASFRLPGGLGVFDQPGKLLLGDRTETGRPICYPGRETERLALTLPQGATLRRLPQDVMATGGGAQYEAHYAVEGAVLRVTRTFTVVSPRVRCSRAAYAAMQGVLAAARRDERVQVALRRAD